jgi:hypothetical protein
MWWRVWSCPESSRRPDRVAGVWPAATHLAIGERVTLVGAQFVSTVTSKGAEPLAHSEGVPRISLITVWNGTNKKTAITK